MKLLSQLDAAISDWVESMWTAGQPQYLVADALSGLSFYEPWTKRQFPNAWRLFSVWRKLEVPSRAPPFTAELIRSLATYAYRHDDLLFAAVFLLGFYGLLRTGEILNLATDDILVNSSHIIVSLQNTKTGKRKGCQEVIHVDDEFTIEVLSAVLDLRESQGLTHFPLWPYSSALFRKRFNFYCGKFGLQSFAFRPYSLRRGGATHHFQESRSMESTLVLGRWESAKVARIYISDALSFLPGMAFSSYTRRMLNAYPAPL